MKDPNLEIRSSGTRSWVFGGLSSDSKPIWGISNSPVMEYAQPWLEVMTERNKRVEFDVFQCRLVMDFVSMGHECCGLGV